MNPDTSSSGASRPGISDEILYAFVDGELDQEERESLLADIQADPELARRVGVVRHLRDMVKLAYAEPPAARRPARRARGVPAWQAIAASLTLIAGLAGGWALRGVETPSSVAAAQTTQRAAQLDSLHPVSLARTPDPGRLMFHLDSDDPVRMGAALDRVEALLDEADRQGRPVELEIVTNSHGINLLRKGISPYAARIERLTKRHANLHLVACSQTIARFTGQGQNVQLLPAARKAPTAIGEIVTRLQQGWTYIRV